MQSFSTSNGQPAPKYRPSERWMVVAIGESETREGKLWTNGGGATTQATELLVLVCVASSFCSIWTPFAYTFLLVLHSESENEIAKLTKASSNSLAEEGKRRSWAHYVDEWQKQQFTELFFFSFHRSLLCACAPLQWPLCSVCQQEESQWKFFPNYNNGVGGARETWRKLQPAWKEYAPLEKFA